MATATLFQVPVYCCCTNLSGTKYHWEAIKLIATPANLRVPEIVEEDPVAKMHTPHHFELLYWELTHFHCIVSQPDDSAHRFLFCLELNTSWILHSLTRASLVPRLSVGGEKRARYPLFAHALNYPLLSTCSGNSGRGTHVIHIHVIYSVTYNLASILYSSV